MAYEVLLHNTSPDATVKQNVFYIIVLLVAIVGLLTQPFYLGLRGLRTLPLSVLSLSFRLLGIQAASIAGALLAMWLYAVIRTTPDPKIQLNITFLCLFSLFSVPCVLRWHTKGGAWIGGGAFFGVTLTLAMLSDSMNDWTATEYAWGYLTAAMCFPLAVIWTARELRHQTENYRFTKWSYLAERKG